jgi:Calcineurin-like phosphoesterase
VRSAVRVPAAVLAVTVLVGACSAEPEPEAPFEPDLHVTVAADFGSSDETNAVLEAMADQDAEVAFALGDLSYGRTGNEDRWCRRVTERLGAEYPFQLLAGNHESDGEDGFIDNFAECLPNRLPTMEGTYAREWYVDLPVEDPLVRFVMISPDITFLDDGTWDYSEGTPHHEWTAETIDGARSEGIPWVVVGAHKPCLTPGVYDCDIGTDIFDLMLEKQVDLVLFGHEHHYARTHQLAIGGDCPTVPVEDFSAACVEDEDASLQQGAGTTFVTVGTGGIRLRDVDEDDAEWDYFAAVSGANREPTHGLLDLEVSASELRGEFVPAATGTFTDRFTIRR